MEQHEPAQMKIKKPKLRIPVPPPDRPHKGSKKELLKKVCRKKVEKDPAS